VVNGAGKNGMSFACEQIQKLRKHIAERDELIAAWDKRIAELEEERDWWKEIALRYSRDLKPLLEALNDKVIQEKPE